VRCKAIVTPTILDPKLALACEATMGVSPYIIIIVTHTIV